MEKKYKCDKCNQSFTHASTFSRHKRRKNPCDVVHKCPICLKIFEKKSRLDRHLRSKQPCRAVDDTAIDIQKTFICNLCNRGFSRASTLNRHKSNYCPVNKMSPEEWLSYVDTLTDKLQRTSQERDEFINKFQRERARTKRLSKENLSMLKRLMLFSRIEYVGSEISSSDDSNLTEIDSSVSSISDISASEDES